MAIKKPLMIIVQDNDSVFITADTLFSARLTDLYASRRSLAKTIPFTGPASAKDSIGGKNRNDSLEIIRNDTLVIGQNGTMPLNDSLNKAAAMLDTMEKKNSIATDVTNDTLTANIKNAETAMSGKTGLQSRYKDSVLIKTTRGVKWAPINEKDSTNRYFEAYRNVRIFNDSLQAASDSLFYSFKDSVFRLYQDPVVWSKENQITGDTILLFTKNKKADRVQAFENGFMVNKLDPQAFNQVKSTRIDGYFTDGNIDSVRARGHAECIYYLQNEDSSYTGVNESKSDVMDIYFRDKELFKVVFRSGVTGTLWPIRQKSPSEMRLPHFRWLDERRPKTKLEMYE